MAARGVHEGRGGLHVVGHQELRNHQGLLAPAGVAGEEEDDDGHEDAQHQGGRVEHQAVRGGPDGEEDGEADDHEDDGHHHGGLLLPPLHGLRLLGGHDLPPLPCGDDPDLRLVVVLRVVVDDGVLQLFRGEELRHGAREHGLARAGVPDEDDVALLLRGLLDDRDGGVLTDDLVDQVLRDLDFRGGL